MKITIDGVRIHDGKSFTFTEKSLTLLDGRNGIGKSTLFDCIYWCLYGKVRELCPNACQVTLEIKNVTITRKTRPNYLQVETTKSIIENEEAQILINKMFGSKTIFESSSYLQQGENCALLTAPADVRMKILNEMTFIETDKTPKKILEELDARQSKAKENQVKAETKYTVIQENHKNNKFTPTINEVITDESELRDEKEKELQSLKKKKQELSNIIASQKSDLIHYNRIQNEINNIEQKLQDLEPDNLERLTKKLESVRKKLTTAQTNKKNKKSDEKLLSQTKEDQKIYEKKLTVYLKLQEKLNLFPEELTTFSENIQKISQQWNQYEYQQQTLKKFPKISSVEDLQKTVQELNKKYEKAIQVEAQMKLHDKYNELRKEKNRLSEKITEVVSEKVIEDLEHKLSSMRTSHDVYACPECATSLRLQNDKLVRSKVLPVSKEQIKDLKDKIHFYKEQRLLILQKKKITSELTILREKLPKDIQYHEGIQQTKKDILTQKGILETISYISPPNVDKETLEQVKKYRSLQEKLKSYDVEIIEKKVQGNKELISTLKKKLTSYDIQNTNDLKAKINNIEVNIKNAQKYVNLIAKKEKLTQDLQHLNVKDTDKTEAKKKELITRIQSIKRYIQEYDNFTEQLKRDDQLQQARQEKDNASDHYERILKLKELAIDLECYLIQKTVDDVNNIANDILEDICQGKMQIELTLFREVKSKKSFKNEVTLHVITDDSKKLFKHNSGGEKKIISFVFMIALCLLNPSPMLLIDEALSEVDSEYRPTCIEALRSYISKSGKTAILVNHNETEGDYDLVKFLD